MILHASLLCSGSMEVFTDHIILFTSNSNISIVVVASHCFNKMISAKQSYILGKILNNAS